MLPHSAATRTIFSLNAEEDNTLTAGGLLACCGKLHDYPALIYRCN